MKKLAIKVEPGHEVVMYCLPGSERSDCIAQAIEISRMLDAVVRLTHNTTTYLCSKGSFIQLP